MGVRFGGRAIDFSFQGSEVWYLRWCVLGSAEATGEGLFVFEKKTFVGGEKVNCFKTAACVEADGTHHFKSVDDAGNYLLVFTSDGRVNDVAETPIEGRVHICQPGRDCCTEVVES